MTRSKVYKFIEIYKKHVEQEEIDLRIKPWPRVIDEEHSKKRLVVIISNLKEKLPQLNVLKKFD